MTETPETPTAHANTGVAARPTPTASETAAATGPNAIVRFVLEIVAVISLAIWGVTMWPMPWPGVLFAIAAPLFAILLWALFLSPRAVFRVDPFGSALFEVIIMGSVAFAWWSMGQPIIAAAFALVATVSGVVNGRNRL